MRDFDVEHEKRMHLIVARRDLTGFQHLHPVQAAGRHVDDVAAAPRRRLLPRVRRLHAPRRGVHAGRRRARRRRRRPGAASRAARRPRARTATTSGSTASDGELAFTITKDGAPVTTEPYLGAGGHLVALREGDLAFLHVHPEDDGVRFGVTFPTAGRYRLFLQFKHAGQVRTVAFTQVVS